MDSRQLRTDAERFGWSRSIFMWVMRGLQRRLGIHVSVVRVRPLYPDPPAPNLPSGVRLALLDRDTLIHASDKAEMAMTREFVDAALARGDVAFGAIDGDRLVAYAWRTFTAAPHAECIWVRADKPYRYGYKGFTHPDYRGQRLNDAISISTDAYFLERGYTEDLSFVDIHNHASRLTAKRKGNTEIGYAGYTNWFGQYFTFRTPGAKKVGFELLVLPNDG